MTEVILKEALKHHSINQFDKSQLHIVPPLELKAVYLTKLYTYNKKITFIFSSVLPLPEIEVVKNGGQFKRDGKNMQIDDSYGMNKYNVIHNYD